MLTGAHDLNTRIFLIIGEPCPSTFLATCLLSQLDNDVVIVHGKCVDQSIRMLDISKVVGAVFVNIPNSQWEEHGAARRFVQSGQVGHCAVVALDESAVVPVVALRKGLVVFRSRRTLATDLEEFFLSNPPQPDMAGLTMGHDVMGASLGVNLTRRQADVLNLLYRGYSSKRIAAQLGLNKGTVDNHVSGLLRAIGANNRAHALAIASDLGILGASPELV